MSRKRSTQLAQKWDFARLAIRGPVIHVGAGGIYVSSVDGMVHRYAHDGKYDMSYNYHGMTLFLQSTVGAAWELAGATQRSIYTVNNGAPSHKWMSRHKNIHTLIYHPIRNTYFVACGETLFELDSEFHKTSTTLLTYYQGGTQFLPSDSSTASYITCVSADGIQLSVITESDSYKFTIDNRLLPHTLTTRPGYPDALTLIHYTRVDVFDLWQTSKPVSLTTPIIAKSAYGAYMDSNVLVLSDSRFLRIADIRCGAVHSRMFQRFISDVWRVHGRIYVNQHSGLYVID